MEENIFESKSIPKAYFSLALPVVFGMVISIVYNITDTYFIALTKNTDLVAGISLCSPIFMLLMAFGNIFGQGGSSLISRFLGGDEKEGLRRVSSFCFYAAIGFGLVAGALMLILKPLCLSLLGADSVTGVYAGQYFTVMAIGAPFAVLSFIHTNLLRAEGMSKESMVASVGGSVVNIILDPLLIFTFGLGAAGAAIATVLGYVFTDAYCLVLVFKKSRVLCVDFRVCRAKAEEVGQIFGIGLSSALSNIMSSFSLILLNNSLLVYGSDKVAAMGIVQKVSMIVMLVIIGFSFGGAPLIGYYYGSGNKDKLRQLLRFVLRFLCGVAIVLSALLILLAAPVMSLFVEDASLMQAGVLMLRAQVCSMVFLAVVQYVSIIFMATGKSIPSLALAVCRQGVVFVLVLAVAKIVGGYYGVIFTQPISDLLTAGIALLMYKGIKVL